MGAGESADDFAAIENSQWYQKFMKQCPSGQITLHEFKKILGLQDMNSQANMYIERVFHVFDMNQWLNGVFAFAVFAVTAIRVNPATTAEPAQRICEEMDGFIDFLEFIAAINLVIRGKIDQKLKWYFKLYDADGNGCIDKKELVSIFTAIQAINGHTDMSAEEFTNIIFEKIDVNNDGELTLEEFITGVERDEDLMDLITKNFDLSNVLKVIQNGRRHSI